MPTTEAGEPPADCSRCPRLVAHRARLRHDHPDWHNAPVESVGPADAHLLIVGLAPGRAGANRTGVPFRGDAAGGMLWPTLERFGLADGAGRLRRTMITNAVRCLPPGNRPIAPEVAACRPFLASRIAALTRLTTILTLGRIAHDATLRALDARPADLPFAHHATATVGRLRLIASYHCSRQNTNTGRLSQAMFDAVFEEATAGMWATGTTWPR